MKRTTLRIVKATGLLPLGWTAGHAAQSQPDFELTVSAPAGTTTITCTRGCGLQNALDTPAKTHADASAKYTCGREGQKCGGSMHGCLE